jgi:hypothetical protein
MDYGENYAADGAGRLLVGIAMVIAIAFAGLVSTWRYQPHVIRGDLDRLEQRVNALEARERKEG